MAVWLAGQFTPGAATVVLPPGLGRANIAMAS
jgi:hypothetical protein